jgi:hypothetical protein
MGDENGYWNTAKPEERAARDKKGKLWTKEMTGDFSSINLYKMEMT